MTPPVDVLVTVDDDHLGGIGEVAERLRAAGMEVKDTLPSIGTVTGSIEDSRVDDLARVEGVQHVEASRQYRIAPPESPIQ